MYIVYIHICIYITYIHIICIYGFTWITFAMPWKLPVHHLLWTLELYPSSAHLPDEINTTPLEKKRQQKKCSKWLKSKYESNHTKTIQKCIKMLGFTVLRYENKHVETWNRTLGFMDSARAKSTRQHFQVWECKKRGQQKGYLWLSESSRLMNNWQINDDWWNFEW